MTEEVRWTQPKLIVNKTKLALSAGRGGKKTVYASSSPGQCNSISSYTCVYRGGGQHVAVYGFVIKTCDNKTTVFRTMYMCVILLLHSHSILGLFSSDRRQVCHGSNGGEWWSRVIWISSNRNTYFKYNNNNIYK